MLASIFALVTIAICLGVVFPIVAVVKCFHSGRTRKCKTGWIIAMILTWPISNYLYLILFSKKMIWRILSVIALLIMLLVIALNISAILDAKKSAIESHQTRLQEEDGPRHTDIARIETLIAMMDHTFPASSIKTIEVAIIKADLIAYKAELRNATEVDYQYLYQPHIQKINATVTDMLQDGTITQDELITWQAIFAGRNQPLQ